MNIFRAKKHHRTRRDWEALRVVSRRVEAYRTFDFATATEGLLERVHDDPTGMQIRYVPLMARLCEDLATQYIRPPRRRFLLGGQPVGPEVQAKLDDIYRLSEIDAVLLEAQQKAVAHLGVLLTVDPTPDFKRVEVCSWTLGDIISLDVDPMVPAGKLHRANRIELEVPVSSRDKGGLTLGSRVYTPDEAYTLLGEESEGIYQTDEGHPFGRVPVVTILHAPPARGEGVPPPRLDFLAAQEAACISHTNVEHTSRAQTASRMVLIGDGATRAAKKLSENVTALGADRLWAFDGEKLAFGIHNAAPDIEGAIKALDSLVDTVASYSYAQPQGLTDSTAITGAGKEAERLEAMGQRWRLERIWRRAEQELLDLIVATVNSRPGGLRIPEGVEVAVDHLYIQSRENSLQEAQSRVLDYATGADSDVERIMREDGLSEPEAIEKLAKRRARYREMMTELRDIMPAGLDRIATFVGDAPAE